MKKILMIVAAIASLSHPAHPAPPAHPGHPAPPAHPADPAQSTTPKPKLFDPLDLGLLDAPDRDQWSKPDQVMDALAVAVVSKVADVGSLGGSFANHLLRRV